MLSRMMTAAALLLAGGSLCSAEIMVFAAASLTDALTEIGKTYEKETGDRVHFNFGASSILARQIQEGARADLFISADEEKMDGLEKRDLLKPGTRRSLLSNSLVIVVPRQGGIPLKTAADLRQVKRLALAEPNTVPAGIYARKYLEQIGLWSELSERVVPTENVRGALAAVESGNVDAAIVYKTDAALGKDISIAFEVPSGLAPKISYPVALLTEGRAAAESERFLASLRGEPAQAVFERFGFVVLSDKGK